MNPFTPNFENAKVGDAVWRCVMTNPYMPNFDDAKVGDMCFSAMNGSCKMNDIDGCLTHNGATYDFELQVKVRDCESTECFDHDGRCSFVDKHPTLFNSFQQFLDYWKWEKENRGKDADTE